MRKLLERAKPETSWNHVSITIIITTFSNYYNAASNFTKIRISYRPNTMEGTWIETNQTLECLLETKSNEDFFEDIYSDPWINRIMITIHFITYIPLLGLVSVAWFERTGQAGPYRTLINRLVSFQIDSVSIIQCRI